MPSLVVAQWAVAMVMDQLQWHHHHLIGTAVDGKASSFCSNKVKGDTSSSNCQNVGTEQE